MQLLVYSATIFTHFNSRMLDRTSKCKTWRGGGKLKELWSHKKEKSKTKLKLFEFWEMWDCHNLKRFWDCFVKRKGCTLFDKSPSLSLIHCMHVYWHMWLITKGHYSESKHAGYTADLLCLLHSAIGWKFNDLIFLLCTLWNVKRPPSDNFSMYTSFGLWLLYYWL